MKRSVSATSLVLPFPQVGVFNREIVGLYGGEDGREGNPSIHTTSVSSVW